MKKKKYVAPTITVVGLSTSPLLAASPGDGFADMPKHKDVIDDDDEPNATKDWEPCRSVFGD